MPPASGNGGGSAGVTQGDQPPANTAKLDNFVPTFSNVQKDYKEFRKRAEIYKKKMELGNRSGEVIYNLVTMMQGKSWDLVEDMSLEQLSAPDAFEKLFQRLDAGFQYDPLTELPDDFEQFFVKLQRKGGQTLQDYMTEFTRAERRLQVTHQVDLPVKVRAWWFLRRSGITKEQRQLILTNVGTSGMTLEAIQKAMSFILGQDSKLESSGRWSKGKTDAFFQDEDDDWANYDYDDDAPAYYGDDDDGDNGPWVDDGQDYYYDESAPLASDSHVFDVEEFDEVYANYQEARGKLNQMRTARGFFPVVAMVQGGPQQDFSYGGKKGKSHGKGTKGKSKSKQMPKPKRPPPDPKGRAAAALGNGGRKLCLRCGRAGHLARNCPAQGDKKRKMEEDDAVNMVEPLDDEKIYRIDEDEDETADDTAVQDGGAASVLGSCRQIRRYLTFLMEAGYDIHSIPVFNCEKGFKYGNSMREITTKCLMLPMFLGGRRVDVLTYVIKGEAPILIGRPLLEKLGLTVDYQQQMMKWPGQTWERAPRGAKGEYLLRLGSDLRLCGRQEPAMVLMPDDVDGHLGSSIPMSQFLENGIDEIMQIAEVDEVISTDKPERVAKSHTRRDGGKAGAGQDVCPGQLKRLQPHVLRKMVNNLQYKVDEQDKVLSVSQTLNKDSRNQRLVWEVFSGLGRTSKYLSQMENVKVVSFSLQTGWDFEKPSHRRAFLAKLRHDEPDDILLSPMCRLWSPLQELNCAQSEDYKTKLVADRKLNHDTILTMCSVAYLEQQRHGRHATLEHPWPSRAWSTRAFRKLEEVSYDVYVDQCQYGLTLPDKHGQDGPVKKPTCFRTTRFNMKRDLERVCQGHHAHVPLEGQIPGGGGARSRAAENYPPALAKALAQMMVVDDDRDEADDVMVFGDEDAEMEQPMEVEKMPETSEGLDVSGSSAVPEDEKVAKNRALKTRVGARVFSYVARLHKNLGHPSPEVLHRMLDETQATSDVLDAAKEYLCPRCQERKQPAGVPPAAGLTARTFNDRLMADTTWIDTDDGRKCIMVMMDHATRYVALRVMKSEKSVDLVKGLERGWIKHFSTPRCLRIDEAKGFAAQHLREWCSQHNIILEIAPAEAHNWIGAIERKHQVVRRALEIYMDDRGGRNVKSLLEAAIYCPGQINNMSYTNGYTPTQWVLGRSAADAHSLTASVFNPGLVSMTDSEEFMKVQEKRLAAQTAFLKADTDLRLRRAMMQNYKESKYQVSVGQMCYYWRLQGTGILQKNKWRGPCRYVAEETDDEGNQTILWLCHGTSLLRCAPHQVRPRVEDMGAVVPVDMKAALHGLQELRARSTTQFRDVMEPETGIEDLLEEEGLGDPGEPPPGDADSGYSATEPADDQDQDVLRGISDAANTSFMFQRLQDEDAEMTPAEHAGLTPAEHAGLTPAEHAGRARLASTMEPEPCPETPNGEPQEKRQRIDAEQQLEAAASTPVPEVGGDELLVEDAFIAEVHDDSLPADWVLIDGSFELDEAFLVSLG